MEDGHLKNIINLLQVILISIIGLQKYGRDWKAISNIVLTRTSSQVRTHAQKFFKKINGNEDVNKTLEYVRSKSINDFIDTSKPYAKLCTGSKRYSEIIKAYIDDNNAEIKRKKFTPQLPKENLSGSNFEDKASENRFEFFNEKKSKILEKKTNSVSNKMIYMEKCMDNSIQLLQNEQFKLHELIQEITSVMKDQQNPLIEEVTSRFTMYANALNKINFVLINIMESFDFIKPSNPESNNAKITDLKGIEETVIQPNIINKS